ncbi:hypothetical protein EC991_010078 [Linnemannia zychae]|nr:hypothetical protein EC991_010078 [Linnemannia zychae]
MTPTSPGAVSTYSSPEGPPISSATGTSFNSLSMTTNTSPWNPAESMSRTQQKLNLQRDSSQDDLNEEEMARRGRTHREMERIQREYRCVRMTSDPLMESMTRCLALQRRQQGDAAAGFAGGEEYSL